MKKFLALLITLLYASLNSCFAFSELYYVKNASVDNIKPIITDGFSSYDFKLTKYDPYYGVSRKDGSDYAVVILQQNGFGALYYYQSNTNKKINKYILRQFRRNDISYEQNLNVNTIGVYDRLAQDIMSGNSNTNRYTFEEAQPVYNVPQTNSQQSSEYSYDSLKGSVAQIASGTTLNVYLQTAINTSSANKGDQIIAVLMKDLVYNGNVVFPQGSLVYGTLTKAVHASYGSRNGKVSINFNQIVTPENKTYNISTEKIDFNVSNDGKVTSVVSNAAVGAIVGALGGLVYAALSGGDIGTAAAIGAGVGAGGALIGSTAEKGVDAEIPSFTEMDITLTRPINVTISY